ncbi:aldehyde ferredoxin oxidoreductase family protein [Mycoplasmatota bacterium WC44]
MNAVAGKILYVNLTTQDIVEEQIDEQIYKHFLSGLGLGTYVLHNKIPVGANPLGPDNVLGFVSGLLTGTGSLMTGRWLAVTKSPLTGGWADSNCGGNFSPAIKQSGYDGIFFTGKSDVPVYLYVDNKGAKLLDASEYWGNKDAVETEQLLIEKHLVKKRPAVAAIGQAGENLSLISGIVNDKGRIAARSGVGAVMGSKNLKAVVLAGTKQIKVHNPENMKEISKGFARKVRNMNLPRVVKGSMLPMMGKAMGSIPRRVALDGMTFAGIFKRWGTVFGNTFGVNGDLPVKNWGTSVKHFKKKVKKTNPDIMIKREDKKYHCSSCNLGCGGTAKISNLRDGKFPETHKPEYETVASFGSLLMNNDLDSIYYINEMLNRAGMDTISAGNTVAYAMECYENGIITKEDTNDLDLSWGNMESVIELLDQMINRKGFGAKLTDGNKKASELIPNTKKYAMNAGGQEPGMHDPRYDAAMGLHMSVDPAPGKHTTGSDLYYSVSHVWKYCSWAPKQIMEKIDNEFIATEYGAKKNKAMSAIKMVVDGTGGCLFALTLGVQHWKVFDWIKEATGWDLTNDEIMEAGLRMQTMRQLFNIREGINPIDFKIPNRLAGSPPLPDGPTKGRSVDIDGQMKMYWKEIGWDDEGKPKSETISKLKLDRFIEVN